jgi:hypothetical protein
MLPRKFLFRLRPSYGRIYRPLLRLPNRPNRMMSTAADDAELASLETKHTALLAAMRRRVAKRAELVAQLQSVS